ncbi:MAG: MerR family transcriptional regulator [Bacteroidota bacterium]
MILMSVSKSFSIKELERFSGIKAHTLRAWEKRYGLFDPERMGNNVRAYTLEHVMQLLSLSLLVEYGHQISKISGMEAGELGVRVAALKSDEARQKNIIARLIVTMFTSETEEFEAALDSAIVLWGTGPTVHRVIMPFLEKVHILSYTDTSTEAHFVVTAIRKKLILAIEKAKTPPPDSQSALLFLPEGEHYDLLLLYLSYVLKSKGLKVLYLGTNISVDNLLRAVLTKAPDYVYSYMADKSSFPVAQYAAILGEHLPLSGLHVAYADEAHIDNAKRPANVKYLQYAEI